MISGMPEGFVFVDSGRTFTCEVNPVRATHDEAWWWFRVSTESNQRFAPFRAAVGDTTDAVRDRVVAYYEHLLARRAEPYQRRWSRERPAAPAQAAPAPQ